MRGRDFSVSGEVRIASNGLKLMKEKFEEGTREQLKTPKSGRQTQEEGNISADSHMTGQYRQ